RPAARLRQRHRAGAMAPRAPGVSAQAPRSLTLLLRDADDLRVVRPASCWTVGRVLIVLGAMAVLLAVVMAWVVMLLKMVNRARDGQVPRFGQPSLRHRGRRRRPGWSGDRTRRCGRRPGRRQYRGPRRW